MESMNNYNFGILMQPLIAMALMFWALLTGHQQ